MSKWENERTTGLFNAGCRVVYELIINRIAQTGKFHVLDFGGPAKITEDEAIKCYARKQPYIL